MSKIIWNENMSVGIKSMDNQHKTLIDAINEFYDSLGSSSSKELTVNLLNKMKEYSFFHFNSEEQLLKKNGYPALDEQKNEHKKYIDKVEELNKRIADGRTVVSLELTSFINSWLTNHILINDKKYTAFLNAKGVF